MSTARPGVAGATRTCPHCRTVILESASVCPACRHHLRFTGAGSAPRARPASAPLRVEGTIRHPAEAEPVEYSVLITIRNERGEEIARHVVGVGALQPTEARTFALTVELFKPA